MTLLDSTSRGSNARSEIRGSAAPARQWRVKHTSLRAGGLMALRSMLRLGCVVPVAFSLAGSALATAPDTPTWMEPPILRPSERIRYIMGTASTCGVNVLTGACLNQAGTYARSSTPTHSSTIPAPVPLPPAILLLIGAVAALWRIRR